MMPADSKNERPNECKKTKTKTKKAKKPIRLTTIKEIFALGIV